jgi:hypothetical protein
MASLALAFLFSPLPHFPPYARHSRIAAEPFHHSMKAITLEL